MNIWLIKYLLIKFLAFCVEFFVTYVLILTVYSAAADKDNEVKGSPPLAIGLAIAVGHLFAVCIPKILVYKSHSE